MYGSLRKIIKSVLAENYKVRGYIKPVESFHTLEQLEAFALEVLALQRLGIDPRDRNFEPELITLINKFMPHLFIDAERYSEKFDETNLMIFIEDFCNHRVWSFDEQFGGYFPRLDTLKFSYFYTRGDIEPYVLLDENYTQQFYGSLNNVKQLKHFTNEAGLANIANAISSGNTFDISCFTTAQKEFFDAKSDLIITLEGNVRAGFRSDVKSFAVSSGRRACNLFRLGYPGENQTNICLELDSCDQNNKTSIWNEYIATPVRILEVEPR
tara:strand:+ start:1369 stop:2175 length:807 start_codon:yes stop_codon:yes gene_type:complete